MRDLDITKKDGGNWWDKYNPTEFLKNLSKEENNINVPYVQGVNDSIPSLPNYEGLINSPTAKKFFELVKDKNYKLGAKGVGNYTNANGGGKTDIDSIDCSGAICTVKNSLGSDYDLTNTNAAKFKSNAKVSGITAEKSLDGDMIVMSTKGKGVDHIGFIVVDDKGRRYIAESSSSYNGTTITPYDERIKDLKKRSPKLTYDIVSDTEDRTQPKPYNTDYDHVNNSKIEVRPPSKVLDKTKEATKQGTIPKGAQKVAKSLSIENSSYRPNPNVPSETTSETMVDGGKQGLPDAQGKELTKEEKQAESYQNIQDEFPDGEYGRGGDVYILPDGKIYSYDGKMGTYDRELKRPKWTHTSYTAGKDWRGTPGYEERQAKKDENIKIKSEEQADIDKYEKKGTLITEGENRGGTRYSDNHYKDIYGNDIWSGNTNLPKEETTSSGGGVNIQDLTEPESKTTTGAIKEGDSRQDIERRIQENKDLLNNLGNRPKFVHDYAPDQQQNTNLAGNIVDAGRGIMGMMGANTEVPVYQRGSMFQTSMDELSQRRNMGLTDTEKDYARNMAERGYGYDVKNIAKFAGGSAGVALGGLGRATGQLYDQYGQIAVRDEGVRRQNRADFNRGALSDEQVNRQIFTDELRQVEMTKQAGAALVQDATKNIRDRTQYEKAYGKGSQMYEYMKTLDKDKQESMFDQEAADARRVEDMGKTAQTAIGDDEKLLQKYGTITPGTVLGGDPTETEGFKTVEELQKLKKEGKIDEDVYQEKLQQQPDDTTMPDDYKFPTNAFDPNSEKVETVRNVSNAPSTRADDYNQGIVGVDAKRPKSAIVDAVEAETTEVSDLATQGIVDEQEIPTEEVADDFVYPTAANPDPTNSNITEEVADVVDEDVESAPKVNPEWDAKYDKATEKEREKMLDEMPKEFDAASFSDETEPEDNIKDYEAELEQNPETLKRYKEDPIAFLEDDIKGWESEPDSDKKTKSLKNLKKNLKYLKSLKKK